MILVKHPLDRKALEYSRQGFFNIYVTPIKAFSGPYQDSRLSAKICRSAHPGYLIHVRLK